MAENLSPESASHHWASASAGERERMFLNAAAEVERLQLANTKLREQADRRNTLSAMRDAQLEREVSALISAEAQRDELAATIARALRKIQLWTNASGSGNVPVSEIVSLLSIDHGITPTDQADQQRTAPSDD